MFNLDGKSHEVQERCDRKVFWIWEDNHQAKNISPSHLFSAALLFNLYHKSHEVRERCKTTIKLHLIVMRQWILLTQSSVVAIKVAAARDCGMALSLFLSLRMDQCTLC